MPEHNTHPYDQIATAIRFLRDRASEQPSLAEVAEQVGLSECHFQRLFSQWAGVSPKRFLQFLTKERAKQALAESTSVFQATLESGLSGPGRLHDLMVSCEAMTPGEIKAQGEGLEIGYGEALTPFGRALVAWTSRGVCYLAFFSNDATAYEQELKSEWPKADFSRDNSAACDLMERVFINTSAQKPLHLLLKGTNFQLKVWEALLRVGEGELVSYSQLAAMAGSPKASRAVGSAMAANKIGFLIPCHRVIRESGESGHYRWESERKLAMQGWEAAKMTLGR
ncbi:methylated-DNA--[protein]-cysteine S-methyltransferase [Neptuniibacter sp.]|uniref:bifunctional helix-turn-helix domain-containing protein/methylated-DNA--[protein]-cysteine S-methyltransferase n=1 Tax=Neptuniibacter sp. TaxID=1962643 RepID=UPI002605A41C|nr:methylated-DNA--[protein]-cysteine S-methyltransferase [Neptuniibacter sp.]MCP4598166.1 methylated-DNA--[protein]-cysteine S-methyltransferase [Neptuniibacter sp.]